MDAGRDLPWIARAELRLAFAAVALVAAISLLVVGLLTAAGSALVLALPIALAVALVVGLARPSPTVQLGGVLASTALLVGDAEGLAVTEVLAGLILVGYLAMWYGRVWAERRPLLLSGIDVAAAAWLFGFAPAALLVGLLFGPDVYDLRADLLATLPFALYFPVKDAAARSERGTLVVAAIFVWLGTYVAVSNVVLLRSVISAGEAAVVIADTRLNMGETSVMAALLLSLAAFTAARQWSTRLAWVALTGTFAVALVLTRSRGFWVAAVLGVGVLWLAAPSRARLRIAAFAAVGFVATAGVAILLFPTESALLLDGTIRRFMTLSTATTADISLINRFAETGAAWERIRVNPILGYGWGVQVTRYDIVYAGTITWGFLHNGYIALWFKTGLFGLLSVLTVWVGGIARGFWASRSEALSPASRACALGAAAGLVAIALAANTSNPFSIQDQMLVITLQFALANGVADRARLTT